MTSTSPHDKNTGRSRRRLLVGAAGALGLLGGQAITSATPAQAGTDGDVVLGALNNAASTTTIDTVDSAQDTMALATGDARTLAVANESLQQTVLATNSGHGAAFYGFSGGGEGLYGQSGLKSGTKPGKTRNGVHGVTDSPTDSGVWGEAPGGGVGVAGATTTSGINGNPAMTGVNLGSGPGVKGESRGGGTAVLGVAVSGGTGVLAQAGSGGGTALEVSGPALFSRSGLVTITGHQTATVSVPGGLSASSLVLALLQTPVSNLWVRAAEPHKTGEITIHLNRAPASSVKVAWFIVN